MKKYLFLLLLSAGILATSCKKNRDGSALQGSWELRTTVGGMLPDQTYPPGNGNRIKFTDTAYEMYEKGALTKAGKYSISPESKKINNDTADYKLVLDGTTTYYLKVSGNKIVIFIGVIAADGVEMTYQKE